MRFILFLILILNCSNLLSQAFNFKQLEVHHGINLIHDICRDNSGYLWLTNGAQGLLRHDSYTSIKYRYDKTDSTSLSNNQVKCLHVDPYNNLWIGTINGLNLYNRETNTFSRFLFESGSTQKNYNHIHQAYTTSDSALWVIEDSTICKYNYQKGAFKVYRLIDSIGAIAPRGIVEDLNGNLWVITNFSYIIKFDPGTGNFERYEDPNLRENVPIQKKIYIDFEGEIWITTKGKGLIHFNPDSKKFFHFPYHGGGIGTNNRHLYDLIPYGQGKLLIAVDQGGINVYDKKTKTFSYLTQENSTLTSEGIFSFWLDFENILWVGTSRNGVFYHNPMAIPFYNYLFKERLNRSANIIGSLFEKDDGTIWIGTDGNGIRVLSPDMKEIAHYTTENTDWMSSNVVRGIEQDAFGNIIAVSWDKLTSFRNDRNNLEDKFNNQLLNIFPTGAIWGIYRDSKNRFWVKFPNGTVALFDSGYNFKKKFFPPKQNFFDFSPVIIEFNNKILVTDFTGINSYDEDENEFYKIIPIERASTFCVNNKYIAVGGVDFGVLIYDHSGKLLKKYDETDGLTNNNVKSMEFDNNQNLWVATINGLNYINIENDQHKQFYEKDGIVNHSFFTHSLLKTVRGKLYFGTYYGLVSLETDSIKINLKPPKLNINDVTVYYDDRLKNQIRNIYPGEKPIELSWKERMFVIHFAAINFNNSEKSEYRYKLEGFNSSWITATSAERTATYTNLNPGLYTFTVQASNSDGIWTKDGVSIQIKLNPPFWKTKLFYFLAAALALLLFYAVLKMREFRLQRDKQDLENRVRQRTSIINEQKEELRVQTEELEKHRNSLEELVVERTKELIEAKKQAENSDKLKTRFLANMSHEIRTPMNAIIGFTDIVLNETLEEGRKRYYASIIDRNTSSLMRLIDDIIDVSKIETNQLIIVNDIVNIGTIVNELYHTYKLRMEQGKEIDKRLLLVNSLPDKNLILETDGVRVKQILNNLISNAVNHSEIGDIEIGAYADKNNCYIYVKDEGPGISKDYQQQIFETFFTLDDSERKLKRGVGLGLAIARKLAELLSGELILESELGKGSKFTLRLPIN